MSGGTKETFHTSPVKEFETALILQEMGQQMLKRSAPSPPSPPLTPVLSNAGCGFKLKKRKLTNYNTEMSQRIVTPPPPPPPQGVTVKPGNGRINGSPVKVNPLSPPPEIHHFDNFKLNSPNLKTVRSTDHLATTNANEMEMKIFSALSHEAKQFKLMQMLYNLQSSITDPNLVKSISHPVALPDPTLASSICHPVGLPYPYQSADPQTLVPILPSSSSTVKKVAAKTTIKKRKICRMDQCNEDAAKRTPYCCKHSGQRKCEHAECNKYAQSRTRFCIGHGGGRRCTHPGCNKGARDKFFCASHGGGRRCKVASCQKLAVGAGEKCTAHGGGKRCQHETCTKSAQSSSNFCVRHGGGRKCKMPGCLKVARGKIGLCMSHSTAQKCLPCVEE
jgi:hypothetical protein